jgi:hypothetical protein
MAVDLHDSYESISSLSFKSNGKFSINVLYSYAQYACLLKSYWIINLVISRVKHTTEGKLHIYCAMINWHDCIDSLGDNLDLVEIFL